MSDVDVILRRVAVHHLPGAAPITSGEGALPAGCAVALVERAMHTRLSGSLLAAVQSGAIVLGAEAAADLEARHRAELARCLLREEQLWLAGDALDRAGVDHLVLKGPAVAHLDEPDPSWRTFADIDLLVRGRHLDRAVEVLRARGATRPWAERRPGYDARFAKSVTLSMPGGYELDLHRSLCDGVHGFRIPLDRLFEQRVTFELGGRAFAALDPVHRLLHAAHHAVLGSPEPKLMSLRDLAGYLARSDLAVGVVAEEARRWRGVAVLAEAVSATGDTFGWLPEAWQDWLDGVEVPAREVRIIVQQKREGSSFGRAKLSALQELPWRNRPAYAMAVLVPSRDHLRSRDMHRFDHLLGGRWRRVSRRAP